MNKEDKVKQFRNDFESKKEIFEAYGNTVAYIIKSLLDKNSFQYQVVSNRVKLLKSIEDKVMAGSIPDSINELTEIDDIIGCRVIFYLESDIERFINLLYEEFPVIKHNLRYSDDGYNAVHLVLGLKPARLELMEYERFVGLKCEVQLTTVLFHSWSEISHNIIYKMPPDIMEFDEPSVTALKKQFEEVMKNHIKAASYDFELINMQFENLIEGKKTFDSGFLQTIINSNSRNEMYEKLFLLRQFIVKFGDKTPKDFDLMEFILDVLKRAKNINIAENTPILGRYRYEYHHIVDVCLDILNQIRYLNVEKILEILIELFENEEERIKNKSIEVLNDLTKYNLTVIEKIGYFPQLKIMEKVEGISLDAKERLSSFLEKLFSNLLSFEFSGYSMVEYNKVGIQYGNIRFNEQLKKVRKLVINTLIEMYENFKEEEKKLTFLRLLLGSVKLQSGGNFEEKIDELVSEEVSIILDWLVEKYKHFTLKEIKVLDEGVYRWIKEYPSGKNAEKLRELESFINNNVGYGVFKTLVGNDLSYRRELSWREVRERRERKTQEYLKEISSSNYSVWQERILSIAECYSPTQEGEFLNLRKFLFDLSKDSPEFAKDLISKNEEKLENFLSNIVAGLMSSHCDEGFGKRLILEWLENNKYIIQCAGVYLLLETVDIDVAGKIFEYAKKQKDTDALYTLFRVILIHREFYRLLSGLFIEIIEELSRHKQFYWTQQIWFEEGSILDFLSEDDFNVILSCLEKSSYIDVYEEEILKPVCIKYPEKIISFFENRIHFKTQREKMGRNRLTDNYDAIPSNLFEINELLREKSEIIIPLLVKWFRNPNWLFEWEAARLIKNIFPKFEQPLQDCLNELINSDDKQNANIVIKIIQEYDGSTNTHEVCKSLIKKYSEDRTLMRGLMDALTRTGVVSGEYGFVEAYKQIKREIRKWEKDKNQEVKKFVREFIRYVNPMITQGVKRADKDIEMRKRMFEIKLKKEKS